MRVFVNSKEELQAAIEEHFGKFLTNIREPEGSYLSGYVGVANSEEAANNRFSVHTGLYSDIFADQLLTDKRRILGNLILEFSGIDALGSDGAKIAEQMGLECINRSRAIPWNINKTGVNAEAKDNKCCIYLLVSSSPSPEVSRSTLEIIMLVLSHISTPFLLSFTAGSATWRKKCKPYG